MPPAVIDLSAEDDIDDACLLSIDVDRLVAERASAGRATASKPCQADVPADWQRTAHEKLQHHWGYSQFRCGQLDAIEAAIHGRDS